MSDDPHKTGTDRTLIALTQDHEVRDWCQSLGCTKEQLEAAVQAVGHSAQQVRDYLRTHRS